MKKALKVLLAAAAISIMATVPAFAAEWLVDPSGYEKGIDDSEWKKAETYAQWDNWAGQYKEEVNAPATQMEKFQKIAEIVKSHFDYDNRYSSLHPYYRIRDGKGSCEDYASAITELCQEAGIECYMAHAYVPAGPHKINLVNLDGLWYWADATDSYDNSAPLYLSQVASDYYEVSPSKVASECVEYVKGAFDAQKTSAWGGGIEKEDGGNANILVTVNVPADSVVILKGDGTPIYIPKDVYSRYTSDEITIFELMEMYPELAE